NPWRCSMLAALLDSISLGAACADRNLTLTPILLKDGPLSSVEPLCLEEAIAARTLRVSEVSAEGHVPELRVKNSGDAPVLILDGDGSRSMSKSAQKEINARAKSEGPIEDFLAFAKGLTPAPRLNAAHRYDDLGVRRHQDGDVDDAVLLGPDQLLTDVFARLVCNLLNQSSTARAARRTPRRITAFPQLPGRMPG